MKFLPLFLFVFLFNYGCDLDSGNQQKPASDPTVPAQVPGENNSDSGETKTEPTLEEIEQNAQNLSVSSFNETVRTASYDQPTWANSPILTALKYSGEGMDCRHKTIDV